MRHVRWEKKTFALFLVLPGFPDIPRQHIFLSYGEQKGNFYFMDGRKNSRALDPGAE
jgi:hypothetical protein